MGVAPCLCVNGFSQPPTADRCHATEDTPRNGPSKPQQKFKHKNCFHGEDFDSLLYSGGRQKLHGNAVQKEPPAPPPPNRPPPNPPNPPPPNGPLPREKSENRVFECLWAAQNTAHADHQGTRKVRDILRTPCRITHSGTTKNTNISKATAGHGIVGRLISLRVSPTVNTL